MCLINEVLVIFCLRSAASRSRACTRCQRASGSAGNVVISAPPSVRNAVEQYAMSARVQVRTSHVPMSVRAMSDEPCAHECHYEVTRADTLPQSGALHTKYPSRSGPLPEARPPREGNIWSTVKAGYRRLSEGLPPR